MSKEILVTGGSGYVMSSVSENMRRHGMNVVAPSHEELDFTDLDQVRNYIKKTGCEVFVHAGGYTNVQKAKIEFEKARLINGKGTENVAIACEEAGARMILLSSDFIFEGREKNPGPYLEDSRRPESFTSINIGHYGNSKLLSEYVAEKYCSRLSIVRISYPFGNPGEKDYVAKLVDRINNGGSVWEEQWLTPTYLPDLSLALEKIISCGEDATCHVACGGVTTPYEIGKYIIDKTGFNLSINKGSIASYLANPGVDIVPQYGGLDTTETRKRLRIEFHSWQGALDEYLERLTAFYF